MLSYSEEIKQLKTSLIKFLVSTKELLLGIEDINEDEYYALKSNCKNTTKSINDFLNVLYKLEDSYFNAIKNQ